ncbi:MAG: 7-cyano-7-deazaguanine synthase [Sulfuricellaceae bacterium]|nr:7-cyano-7-deazaguanine synthase [Sulfuricellaceae bacterium]
MKPAVILLSGGLDSATTLAMARSQGFECYCLSLDYGQRHRSELQAAAKVAAALGAVEQRTVKLDLTLFGGSALTDANIAVPTAHPLPNPPPDGEGANVRPQGSSPWLYSAEAEQHTRKDDGSICIPITYVPARNTIMLSLAMAWAEVLESQDIFIGANAVDYSGYPDCRPAYIEAFQNMANLATKAALEGHPTSIHAPLIHLSKAEIIRKGMALGVDYGLTVSCYQADMDGRACGACDSCRLRQAGFEAAGVKDPTQYI